ncbi:acetoacetate decarboxylase family protein [Herbiconiux sp. CPCC 203407]|uniref:Acetoacetate decarboxylase family protein n=1 Tax=Herbiconiux oxytropis TaxID=2970915 RepID=A0AA41XJM8_9MICO|nr:acetoacetate decarboxylase family protein [Herbiconiux oxytropis]MCS5721827.1 acetoacetate decarboxylase family protein [Herbiconiux oxytropis]MCS5727353.1 acetoacetate decarboxylase family protein [Herbiconiux oxytropis]
MSRIDRADYGTDQNPAGVSNVLGARPGTAAMHGYDAPQHSNMTRLQLTFETTHTALQKLIAPPPLEVDLDAPAYCTIMAFTSPHFRGRDGRVAPYTGFSFWSSVDHRGTKAQAGWEFVDGAAPAHDKTVPEMLIFSGQVYGMLKKFGDIRFYLNGSEVAGDLSSVEEGDDVLITVDRKSHRIASLRVQVAGPLNAAAPEDETKLVGAVPVMAVREIPTVDYKGFVDRSIVSTDVNANKGQLLKKQFVAKPLHLEFWPSEAESLDDLDVGRFVSASLIVADVAHETISTMFVVESLPLTI